MPQVSLKFLPEIESGKNTTLDDLHHAKKKIHDRRDHTQANDRRGGMRATVSFDISNKVDQAQRCDQGIR